MPVNLRRGALQSARSGEAGKTTMGRVFALRANGRSGERPYGATGRLPLRESCRCREISLEDLSLAHPCGDSRRRLLLLPHGILRLRRLAPPPLRMTTWPGACQCWFSIESSLEVAKITAVKLWGMIGAFIVFCDLGRCPQSRERYPLESGRELPKRIESLHSGEFRDFQNGFRA